MDFLYHQWSKRFRDDHLIPFEKNTILNGKFFFKVEVVPDFRWYFFSLIRLTNLDDIFQLLIKTNTTMNDTEQLFFYLRIILLSVC